MCLVWQTQRAARSDIEALLQCMYAEQSLLLSAHELFGEAMDQRVLSSLGAARASAAAAHSASSAAQRVVYDLKGMIAYYGQHYIAVFNNTDDGSGDATSAALPYCWLWFDDKTVHRLGHTFDAVCEKLLRGNFQPQILFYEQKSIT